MTINEQEAIARARQIAADNNWAWVEPAQALWRGNWLGKGGKWEIFSNALGLGAKARIVLDSESGEVLEQGYVPR